MFTGIIQNQGIVKKRQSRGGQICFAFRFLHPWKFPPSSLPPARGGRKKVGGLTAGASLAVNGVCLTVGKVLPQGFAADVMGETLKATTLSTLRVGDRVNLERALKADGEIGGHFVTGHVDCRGRIEKIRRRGKNLSFEIKVPGPFVRYLSERGSVAVDGVSLTIQSVRKNSLSVGLVPHTLRVTILGKKKAGDCVNLEADLIARYRVDLK